MQKLPGGRTGAQGGYADSCLTTLTRGLHPVGSGEPGSGAEGASGVDGTRIIVLNGGSSSGKSAIVRCLQAVLPEPWLRMAVDDLVDALPPMLNSAAGSSGADGSSGGSSLGTGTTLGAGTTFGDRTTFGDGISFGAAGEVVIGSGFRELEAAWTTGIAAMARAGARIIIDDVFLSAAASQERTRALLAGLDVLWVGVRCDPDVAAARELARGDRAIGMARSQAAVVHQNVRYDVEVDTGRTEALDCARLIAAYVRRDGSE